MGDVCSWGVCLPMVLGVCSQGVCSWRVSTPGGVPAYGHGGCLLWGVLSAPGGSLPMVRGSACLWHPGGIPTCNGADPPPSHVNRMTDRGKNIILPQTSFAGGKNTKNSLCLFFEVFLISSKTFLLRLTM